MATLAPSTTRAVPYQTSSAPYSIVSRPDDLWLGFDPYCPALLEARRKLRKWYNDGLDRGEAIVLAGGYGTGKTHLARVVVHCYGDLVGVRMVSEPDMIAHIRASYGGDGPDESMVIAGLRRSALLILDDVGTAHVKAESQTWLEDIYWRIFDRRAEKYLPVLITTNLQLKSLGLRLGGKAFSRLTGMMGGKDAMMENYVDLFGVADYRLRGMAR